MGLDKHRNFAHSYVAVAPTPAVSGNTLEVEAGTGADYPDPPFNATVCPPNELPKADNSEIIRVTAITGDELTFDREQEGTTARAIAEGDQIFASWTSKMLDEIEESLSIVKTKVEIDPTASEATPETFTTNAGKLRFNYGTTPFRAIDLTKYSVSVQCISYQEARIIRISEITQAGTDITFQVAISVAGGASGDGKYYCDFIFTLQKL